MRFIGVTALWWMCVATPAVAQNQAGDAQKGDALYTTHCVACHQVGAVGLPGIAPALVNNIGRHASHEAGRSYLTRVMLTGMVGPIQVGGRYSGNMPSFAKLSDADVVKVLTYVLQTHEAVTDLTWLTPEFVATIRQAGGTPNETHQQRSRLLRAAGE